MEKYLGVKLIKATPSLEGIAYKPREGYIVEYENGYISWSPKEAFKQAYRRIDNLTFGLAIEALKKGYKVARQGWNGKKMWLGLIKSNNYIILEAPHGDGQDTEDGECKGLLPWIGMKTADDKFVPWLANQTDVLAEDWVIVE